MAQLIAQNPASKVKAPKVEEKECEYFTEEEIDLILNLLEKEDLKYKLLIILALETGCRKSELLGLEWTDINFKDRTIYVGRASQYTTEKGIFTKETKNKSSKRSFTISDQLISILMKYKKVQIEQRLELEYKWGDHNRLFTQWDGKPMHPATPNTWFQKFLKRNNLPQKRFHSLRHTNATFLIAENVDPRTVMNRLGQTRPETLFKIYTHALKRSDHDAVSKVSNLIYKTNKA